MNFEGSILQREGAQGFHELHKGVALLKLNEQNALLWSEEDWNFFFYGYVIHL